MTALRHVETTQVPGRRLGRRPHDPARPVLRFSRIATGTVPDHPLTVDHFSRVQAWGMLGNDQWGDCGPAMEVHDRMLIAKYLAGVDFLGTTDMALDLYKRSGNPNFPADDNGVVLADMLSVTHKPVEAGGGVAGVSAVAYASVNVADLDEVRAAIAIFGTLHLGVDLQTAQQAQTDHGGPWDYKASGDWGGHAVLAGFYTSDTTAGHPDISVITWGGAMGITDAFWRHQTQEAWVVVWPEHLRTQAFLDGVDQAALARDYQALTGKPLPVPPVPPTPAPPGPTPGPAPSTGPTADQLAANVKLAPVAHSFVNAGRISRFNQMDKTATALSAWLKAWNL